MLVQLQVLEQKIQFLPYIYAICGNILLVCMQICMKTVVRTITPFTALYLRGVCLLVINTLLIRTNHVALTVAQTDKQVHSLLIKRSIFSTISLTMLLTSMAFLPIGISNSLYSIAPLIVFYLEASYYQKSINKLHFGLTFVCFIGVLLIIKPGFLFSGLSSTEQYLLILPLIGAFFHACSMFYLHMLKGKANVIIVLQYFYLVQVFGTGMLQNFQEMKVMEEVGYGFFLWLGGLVGFAYVMQNMLSRATLLKKASYIMPFGYVSIVVSSICDIIVFGVDFDWLSGIGMVMASVGLVSQLIVGEQ